MLNKIYNWLHKSTSKCDERNEYSAGYWQNQVRQAALLYCKNMNGRILEVGCGEGLFLAELAKANPGLECVGVDNNQERVSQSQARVKEAGLSNVNISYADAKGLKFNDSYFDAVACINVFFNLPSLEVVNSVLKEICRVSKSSGRIIFDVRNAGNPLLKIKYKLAPFYDPTVKNLPLNTYNFSQVKKMLQECRLKLIDFKFIGFPKNMFSPIIIFKAQK
ncbi:MAG: class I SAM-dependent methyltransferase [Candidatus Omnitrophota bacterium]